MRSLFPKRRQWRRWTLPTKVTVVSFYLGVCFFVVSVSISLWQLRRSVDDVDTLLREMARRSRPIERITLEAAFRIPFSEPTLQEFPSLRKYKTSVDREFREIFKAHSTSPESFPDRTGIGRDARIIRDGEVIDRFWLSSEHDLFPQNADPSVRNLISVSLIEVALYREPVDPQSFVLTRLGLVSTAAPLPERMEPDLGIEDRPDAVHWRFTARYSEDRDYQLHLREWTPNRSD